MHAVRCVCRCRTAPAEVQPRSGRGPFPTPAAGVRRHGGRSLVSVGDGVAGRIKAPGFPGELASCNSPSWR